MDLQDEPMSIVQKMPRENVWAPLRATVLRLTDWMAASGMTVFPAFRMGVTLTSSHCMGTYKSKSEH